MVGYKYFSSVMREIWNEYGDEPEQLATNELQQEGKGRRKDIEAQAHKIKFEEENFIRIQEKKGHRSVRTSNNMKAIFSII